MTRSHRVAALVLGVSLAAVLTGCTVDQEPSPAGSVASAGSAPPAAAGNEGDGQTDGGLSSEEISARLLDDGEAVVDREPVASVEAELEMSPTAATVTLDVLAVVATDTGTAVQMRVTAPQTYTPLGTTFSAQEFVNPEYLTDIELVDPATAETLEVITAAEGGRWCACSVIPSRVSPVPTPLQATFPALAEGSTTVDIRFGRFPVVEDVPVTR